MVFLILIIYNSCIAFNDCQKGDKMDKFELYPMLDGLFLEAKRSVLIDSFFLEEVFFHPMFDADEKGWPQQLHDLIEAKRVEPQPNWLEKNPKVKKIRDAEGGKELLVKHHFGQQVHSVFTAARCEINNHLNKYYIAPEDLKSGESPAALLEAIRNVHRHEVALAKAADFIVNKTGRLNRKSKKDSTPVIEWDPDTERKNKVAELLKNTEERFFPPHWLSFCVLSLPAAKRCLQVFQTQKSVVMQSDFIPVSEESRKSMSRQERRLHDRTAATDRVRNTARGPSPTVSDGGSGNRGSDCTNVVHTVDIQPELPCPLKRARDEEDLKLSKVRHMESLFNSTNTLLSFYEKEGDEAMVEICRKKLRSVAAKMLAMEADGEDDFLTPPVR